MPPASPCSGGQKMPCTLSLPVHLSQHRARRSCLQQAPCSSRPHAPASAASVLLSYCKGHKAQGPSENHRLWSQTEVGPSPGLCLQWLLNHGDSQLLGSCVLSSKTGIMMVSAPRGCCEKQVHSVSSAWKRAWLLLFHSSDVHQS